jgi:hypothetical protein
LEEAINPWAIFLFFLWGVRMAFEMHFYVVKTPDGLYHVQNIVAGRLGQHHVHSEKSYERWAQSVDKRLIHYLGEGECNCGLKCGDIREYDGTLWHNPKFE